MEKIDKIMPYVLPLILVALLMLYYLVDPLSLKFPIKCPWYLLTGTQCPACGFQRAMHALVHGEVGEALKYNYFFVFSIPYASLAVLVSWYNFDHTFDRLKNFVFHSLTLKCYVILYFGWWILRNVFSI